MSNILKSARLDYRIQRPYYLTYVAPYAMAVVVSLIFRIPVLVIGIALLISAPISGVIFSVYEKNHLSKLYGILPVRRTEVVIGRYLYILSFGIAIGVTTSALAYAISLITHSGLSFLTFSAALSTAFGYYCLLIAILFPFYFRFAFSKVYVLSNLPLYIMTVGIAWALRKTDLLQKLGHVIQYFTAHQAMIWVTGIGAGLVLLALSCSLSCTIYRRVEL